MSLLNPANYSLQIGDAVLTKSGTVKFYELTPHDPDKIYIEYMPVNTCLRCNAEGGKMLRSKQDEVRQKLEALSISVAAYRALESP